MADSPDYNLPNGVNTTFELVSNKSISNSYVASVNAKDPTLVNNTIIAIKNDTNVAPLSPLIGSWYYSETSEAYPNQTHTVLTFLDNAHYALVVDESARDSCEDGIESGNYTWNATTGELIISNSQGPCVDNSLPNKLTINGSDMTIEQPGFEAIHFTKLIDSSLNGTWANQGEDKSIDIITVIDGTTFICGFAGQGRSESTYGTYTYNATTGQFDGVILNDQAQANFQRILTLSATSLTSTGSNQQVTVFNRLPLFVLESPYIGGIFSITNGETYPLRVKLYLDANGQFQVLNGEYDFHKLDGTMTPCDHNAQNAAEQAIVSTSQVLFS